MWVRAKQQLCGTLLRRPLVPYTIGELLPKRKIREDSHQGEGEIK
jgi:hypothetical protein